MNQDYGKIIKMEDIRRISIGEKDYPAALKTIQDPPKVLYFKGNFDITKKHCFAIVGTRRCSPYGKQAALEIAGGLTTAGLVIISGMARGIDTTAHLGCLESNGKTIAVLGTGLDIQSIYPQTNLKLAQEIIEKGGLLISEYPPGTHGSRITFPKRNRLIAGLALGVLVVEAKRKSGSLITADWAKKQRKRIFAIPGPIHSLNSWGPNHLIKRGAKLVTSTNDILKELDLACPTPSVGQKGETPEEDIVLKALQESSLSIDKITEQTNLPVSVVASILTQLEIKNKVRNLGGNIYVLSR